MATFVENTKCTRCNGMMIVVGSYANKSESATCVRCGYCYTAEARTDGNGNFLYVDGFLVVDEKQEHNKGVLYANLHDGTYDLSIITKTDSIHDFSDIENVFRQYYGDAVDMSNSYAMAYVNGKLTCLHGQDPGEFHEVVS